MVANFFSVRIGEVQAKDVQLCSIFLTTKLKICIKSKISLTIITKIFH